MVLAVSMGEPAGIGPDLILSLFSQRVSLDLPQFCVFGSAAFLKTRAERLGLAVGVVPIDRIEAASDIFRTSLPVIDIAGDVPDRPGQPDPTTAPIVIAAIERAVASVLSGAASGLVTAPIHKAVLIGAGFAHPGHTEFLAALCAGGGVAPRAVMMLAHEAYRVVPLTIHVPLRAVAGLITEELIAQTVRIVARDLTLRFAVPRPILAVAGLNPHAGEDGMIGTEERDIIGPSLEGLRAEGFEVEGPLSADTLFHPPHWTRYDAVIAMYHDQALVPIKTLAFESGVNVTLGLPIVRTSPDHGTAFALAGTGKASEASFLAALRLAERMGAR